MSLHDLFIVIAVFTILASLFWKWKKSLLIVVLLELSSSLILLSLLNSLGSQMVLLILMFVFFVGEALIMLASLYFYVRSFGVASGVTTFL